MPRSPERHEPFRFDINETDLEAARAAFFDPENRDAELEAFFDSLLDMSDGREGQGFVSRRNPQVFRALRDIFDRVKEAQRFNERYLGHMLSEPSIPSMLGYMLAMRINSNTVSYEVSELESELEPIAIQWMAELIGYDPDKASGTFTSGGSLANTTAFWVAREKAEDEHPDYEGQFVILTSPFAHYSVKKSAEILAGPSTNGRSAGIVVEQVGSENLAMDPEALEDKIRQLEAEGKVVMAVVAIAGETETGVIDPLDEIADVTKQFGIFLHADAAYGLPYKLSSRGQLFDGIERADSVTFDPHKALYVPYSAGAVIFKNPKDHGKINFTAEDAGYTFDAGVSLGQKRIEGSMGAGGILATIGFIEALTDSQLQALYDHTLNNIEYMYDRLEDSSILMPIHTPDLNVLCFTLRPEFRREIGVETFEQLHKVVKDSRQALDSEYGFFFSATDLDIDDSVEPVNPGDPKIWVFRAVLMHPRTEPHHIDEAIAGLEDILEGYLR